jgi:hypothetical protein
MNQSFIVGYANDARIEHSAPVSREEAGAVVRSYMLAHRGRRGFVWVEAADRAPADGVELMLEYWE